MISTIMVITVMITTIRVTVSFFRESGINFRVLQLCVLTVQYFQAMIYFRISRSREVNIAPSDRKIPEGFMGAFVHLIPEFKCGPVKPAYAEIVQHQFLKHAKRVFSAQIPGQFSAVFSGSFPR
jgi:hypothetical protein